MNRAGMNRAGLSLVLTPRAERELARPPVTAGLTAAQRQVLAQALADAIAWREPSGYCADCITGLGPCPDCAADADRCGDYLHLANELNLKVPS